MQHRKSINICVLATINMVVYSRLATRQFGNDNAVKKLDKWHRYYSVYYTDVARFVFLHSVAAVSSHGTPSVQKRASELRRGSSTRSVYIGTGDVSAVNLVARSCPSLSFHPKAISQ